MQQRSPKARQRFQTLLELYDASTEIMRQNLRRRDPRATEAEIETRLRRWLTKADEPAEGPWNRHNGHGA